MSKKKILPQRNFVFGSGGARIELDADAHADIDYDFFDSGGKTMNKHELLSAEQKKDLKSRSPQIKVGCSLKMDSDHLEKVDIARGSETDEREIDEKIISNGNDNLNPPENDVGSKLNVNSNGAGQSNVSVRGFKDCDNTKLFVESRSKVNPGEPEGTQGDSQGDRNQRRCIEADEGYTDVGSDDGTSRPNMPDPEQVKKRNLMNCIAYSSSPSKESLIPCKKSQSEPNNTVTDSASSNTTSEMTDVSSRASSSNYSLRRGGIQTNSKFTTKRTQQGNYSVQPSQSRGMPMNLIIDPMRNMQIYEHRRDSRMSSSTFLSKSSYDSSKSRILPARKNMSFTNDEMWKIERENGSLLKKIEGKRSALLNPRLTPANHNLSSSAINRRKVQSKIDQENQRLVKKLKTIRPVTDTSGPWRQVRH